MWFSAKHADTEGNVTYYGESAADLPALDGESGKKYRMGDVFICKAGTEGIETYMLLPKGDGREWWKVG